RQPWSPLSVQNLTPQLFVRGNQSIFLQWCSRVSGLQAYRSFFFPQKLPLDAAGVHFYVELVLHLLCQLSKTQGWLQGLLFGHEFHHFRSELVTVSRTTLLGK